MQLHTRTYKHFRIGSRLASQAMLHCEEIMHRQETKLKEEVTWK